MVPMLSVLTAAALFAPPSTVQVQGQLRSAGGLPVDGDYSLTLRLFSEPTGGTSVFEDIHVAVPVKDGVFSLALDDISPAWFATPGDHWLEVQVEADPPLTRSRMAAVPMALVADTALNLLCSGCVGAGALAPGAVSPSALALACNPGDVLRRTITGWDCVAVPDDAATLTDLAPYARLDTANTWTAVQTLGADMNFALNSAKQFRFEAAATEPATCTTATVGLAYFDIAQKQLFVCDGAAFVAFARLGLFGTENNPGISCQHILSSGSSSGSGTYWIRPATKTYRAYCDMTTAGGGWTMLLNLNTSDGHVMWWANPLWTNGATRGDPVNPFIGDLKSDAWNDLSTATRVLVMVHQNGAVVGWRVFQKSGAGTMASYFAGADNTLLGSSSTSSDFANVWTGERLVRLSTTLYANHCVQTGGTCTSGTTGSPDGDRIGSHEAIPSDNNGGGLGNWHDMHYCCAGQSYAGLLCNGAGAFRTTSEAQAGWGGGQNGTFGSDSQGTMTNLQTNGGSCGDANWARASGVEYDYAVFFGN